MLTPAYPSPEQLPQAGSCIEQPPVVDEQTCQRVAMLRDRAAGAHDGAAGLLDLLFHELTPEARAKARAHLSDLRDAAEVMRTEGRLADAALSARRQREREKWLTDLRADLNETRLLADRTA